MRSDSDRLKGVKTDVRREITLSLFKRDGDEIWENGGKKNKVLSRLYLSAYVSFLSFCTYFCVLMDKSSQTGGQIDH